MSHGTGAPTSGGRNTGDGLVDERGRTFGNFMGDLTSKHKLPGEAIMRTGAGLTQAGFGRDLDNVVGSGAAKKVVLRASYKLAKPASKNVGQFYEESPGARTDVTHSTGGPTPNPANPNAGMITPNTGLNGGGPTSGPPASDANGPPPSPMAGAQPGFNSQGFAQRADQLNAPYKNDMV